MKKLAALVTFISLFGANAYALDLQMARSQGMIGEKLDGYTAPVAQNADVVALSNEVNAKRKAEYSKISAENGQPADVIATLAAGQIIKGLPAGAQYQDKNGNWLKK